MAKPLVIRILHSLALQSIEAFLAALMAIAGIPILFNPDAYMPPAIARSLPDWIAIGWSVVLSVGGVLTLVATLIPSYRSERIGVSMIFGAAAVYAICLSNSLPGSWLAMVTYIMFSAAMAGRYWAIGQMLKMADRLHKIQIRIRHLEEKLKGT